MTNGNFAVPIDKGVAVDSSSVRAPTRSLVSEDLEGLYLFEQSTLGYFHFSSKALKVTEDSFNALQNCSSLKTIRSKKLANNHVGTLS